MFTPNNRDDAHERRRCQSQAVHQRKSHAVSDISKVVASSMARLTEPEALAAESVDSRTLQQENNERASLTTIQ